MTGELNEIELEKCFSLLSKVEENYFNSIWWTKQKNVKCFDEEYGKILYENNFAEHIFKIGDIEYKLTPLGEKLFDNMYLGITNKEKRFYSRIVDLKVMATKMKAKDHKKYYENIMQLIWENKPYIKMFRVHERSFKDFIEEYDVLIKYTIAKYGEEKEVRFCGHETGKKIKCDGIIFGENEERIEITYPLFDLNMNNLMKELNNYGHTSVETIDATSYKNRIRSIIEAKIDDKNENDSYDESVSLVVALDMYDYLFDKEITTKEYYDDLFEDIKKKNYKFKNIEALIENNSKDTEPWIYIIK
jgi:hypothetical protein